MKIAIIPPITNTGEGRYSDFLINGLNERGLDVEIINDNFLFNRPNIKVFLGSLILNKRLKDKNIDILHNTDNLGPFIIRHMGIKTVCTIHDITPVLLPEMHNLVVKFNFKTILPRLINNMDSVIVPSHSTKKDLIEHFRINKNKINVIPSGIDKSLFYPRTQYNDTLKKYGINNKYLMYAGGNNPRKNLKNLILAYSEIFDEIPYDLVLVGPINRDDIVKIVKNNENFCGSKKNLFKRIIFPGYVNFNDLPIIYSAASAFIFPSLYEGFGFPPLESMACGTPVLVSNNSSLKEVVGNAGAYLNNPLDPQEISEDIKKLLQDIDLQETLKKKGIAQSAKFKWEKTIENTIKIYDKLLYH